MFERAAVKVIQIAPGLETRYYIVQNWKKKYIVNFARMKYFLKEETLQSSSERWKGFGAYSALIPQ